jgi:4-amino-4-deoxy-L-arabinose transferase-like glycosyltransferase
MDGQSRSSAGLFAADRTWLLLLVVCILPLRIWLLCNTEVTARDSITFIRFAHELDTTPWRAVLMKEQQHPGYPVAVWLFSKPLQAVWGTTAGTMQLAAQLVSLIASLLLAVVMFRLGVRLWNQSIGFLGALLFQFLPGCGHHLSDGISEGLFLLCVASALWLFVRGAQTRRILDFVLGGACAGLAYLIRPEGLIVIAAFGIFWIAYLVYARPRWPWRSWTCALTAAVAMCVLVGSVYVAAIGKLSVKPNVAIEISLERFPDEASPILFASVWASNFVASGDLRVQLGQTLRALVLELCQGFHYVGCVSLLWGVLFCGRRLAARSEFWLLPIYLAIHTAALVYLGVKASYVSERHVMPLVMLGSYICAIGIAHFAELVVGLWARCRRTEASPVAIGCLVALLSTSLLATYLTKTVLPLHGNRVGNREAGRWLAGHVRAGDVIVDEHQWSKFYSGLFFRDVEESKLPPDPDAKRYTVVTRWIAHGGGGDVADIRNEAEKHAGRLAFQWPTNASSDKARVVVYETPRDPVTGRSGEPVEGQTVSRPRE